MKKRSSFKRLTASMIGIGLMLVMCESAGCATIEATYAADGPFAVASRTEGSFTIFYPAALEGDHPIIAFGNGTGAPTMIYRPLLRHLASWGFVVIDSNGVMTQTGDQLVDGIDYLMNKNEQAGSIFYRKLDTEHIGTSGHSQGGGGAINAATDHRVTCSVPIAPSPGQIGQVDGPIFLVAGKSDFLVSAALVRSTSYARANAPVVFGIVDGMGHMAFSGNAGDARGYITAWFMYHLQNDPLAAEAFTGPCEICENRKWEVDMKNFP